MKSRPVHIRSAFRERPNRFPLSGSRFRHSPFSTFYFQLSTFLRSPSRATSRARSAFTLLRQRGRHAFTLIELMIVIAIIAILFVLVVPALTSLKGADDFTKAAYTITSVMEQARSFSISKNTYVWLGFYEENAAATTPTTSTAPYSGKGRLVMATVYSKDGTAIYDPALTLYSSGSWPLNLPGTGPQAGHEPASTDPIAQLGRIAKIDSIHMTDIGSPTPAPSPSPDSLEARSSAPYSSPSAAFSSSNRLSSDSTDATRFQFTVQGYTFWKTVRFSPRGEVRINTSYDYRRVAEIGLIPTHGNIVPSPIPANVIAIQFDAFGGHFRIYRR